MAPPLLSFENLGVIQGAGYLFRHLDINIQPRDRLALIGRNGAGKTTLLKLLAGVIEPDEGRRSIQPGLKLVLLEQAPSFEGCETLADYALAGADAPPRYQVEAIADQLGVDLSRSAQSASGGEQRRAAIARALAMEPDLLLMDEPTNHLDLAAIEFLEGWLNRFRGAFIVISHDRTFLTRLTRQCLWLDRGQVRRAEIGFGGFEAWMEKIQAEEVRAAEKLDAKLKLEEHWLIRGVTARRKRNQGRLTKLYEMRAERKSMTGPEGTAKLAIDTNDVRTKIVIEAKHISKSFGDREIIKDFSLRVRRGDRIGIVGANGAGKTTLLKLLMGEIEPDQGSIKRAENLEAVVIDQQRAALLPDKTLRDIIAHGGDWIEIGDQKKHVVGYLKDFLFDPALLDAKVSTLSGGERSRLLMAREFARRSNLLILDEPTNDLDLETIDLLQEVISNYSGTVLLVSHDRDFLDNVATTTLGMDGSGVIDVVAGGYSDWQKQRADRLALSQSRASAKNLEKGDATATTAAVQKPTRFKLSYKDQRDYDLLPEQIEKMEAEIASHEAALADPELYTRDPAQFSALTDKVAALRDKKEDAEMRWLELAEQVEASQ
ncbi:MAG: ATP-binding cassette domain-containing protein [Zymomonas mobilis subsp. pomaceae]|uniref:ABC transporter related protein n=1 Tax=Zymomonas mobilis subsp. pomaceae (strain ATCC 29192 / DSM 22645 / JCM 10191 / CCUG 17912 / NBRC 13757 / NCIMB 11200 / NRRL B-4491 / Barker I) TaxID=579138 RepID=F8ETS8_ZYMMT|nr:ATP-binding cassette domain-containing protein [Zymomonas mobilis]AEI38025.1 ABC transporter related protein [Zymomonas mobilis subsp. pomaceae ATCC 29192]MDX5949392.1 ATP-binding cassette domain-containing protein [Zymomonas mobilis subsp. pomaceae]GEB89135.1 elongation factor 3 [Zymomonas mobilis subsp. pomaceae]